MSNILFSCLQTITGPYMNWQPWGFDVWNEEIKFPVTVITRPASFHDYPGDNDPNEGKMVHITGQVEPDGLTIHAQRWEFEGVVKA